MALHQQASVVLALLRRLRQYCRPRLPSAAAAAGQLRHIGTSQLRRLADHLLESLLALSVISVALSMISVVGAVKVLWIKCRKSFLTVQGL